MGWGWGGGGLGGNLIWRIGRFVSTLPNEILLIFFNDVICGWGLETFYHKCQSMSDASFKDGIVQVLTRQRLTSYKNFPLFQTNKSKKQRQK